MSVHSVDGYISALVMRSSITVLVEGLGDKKVISRVVLELKENARIDSDKIIIDTAELLKSEGAIVGNRMLVEHTCQEAINAGVNDKLTAIVDREFRGFVDTRPIDTISAHAKIGERLFWTRGHSMENYFFTAEYFVSFLKQQYALKVTHASLQAVREAFPYVLRWACAVGLALRDHDLIKRADRMQKNDVWKKSTSSAVKFIPQSYVCNLAERGVNQEAISNLSTCITKYHVFLQEADEITTEQWLAHGHIGWEILWSGVAFIIRNFGFSPEDVSRIETGYNDVKINCASDLLAQKVAQGESDMMPEFWCRLKELVPPK